jgi:hypothetical protein
VYLKHLAISLGIVGLAIAQPANAELLSFGSSFTIAGLNSPNTFSETDTLTAGTTSVDGGLLSLNLSTVPVPGGGEWAIFTFQTASGGTIAGDINSNWSLGVSGVGLTQPLVLTHFYLGWGTNGTLFSPTTSIGGNLPVEVNPVTGIGNVYGKPFSIFLTSDTGGSGAANTFNSFLGQNGFPVTSLNTFQLGELLQPVPLPASWVMMLSGLAGFGFIAYRGRNKKCAAVTAIA